MKRPALSQAKRNSLDWLMQLAFTTLRLFARNGLQNHAAATSFYFMLSATPLLLLLSFGVQWLLKMAEHSDLAAILIVALYEQLHLNALTETGFIPNQGKLASGGVGLLTLVLSSRGLLNTMQSAFAVIFPEGGKRKLVVSTTLPLLTIPIAFAVVIVAGLARAILIFFGNYNFLGPATTHALEFLSLCISFITVWGLVFFAYWRLPLSRPALRPTLLVSLLSCASLLGLFSVFNHFFRIESYQALYGALGGVVFVLIGALLAWLIFYFWAQCLFALGKVDVEALERLFLGGQQAGASKLESYVFGRGNRLLDKYGKTFAPGEVLIHEGESGQAAYFLYSGRTAIYKRMHGEERLLGHLDEGELFGEMAYLLGEARTATIRADTEVVVLQLPPETLEELMRHSAPLSRRIIGTLCSRLQRMNQATAN